jgi:hypothetical protein
MNQNQDPFWLVPAIIAAFLVVFPAFWCGICVLLSWMGGWSRMAQQFTASANQSVQGKTLSWRSGRVGGVNYKGVLNIRTNKSGMHLSVMPLFRAGHPPLFIPWDAVHGRTPTSYGFFTNMMKGEVGSPVVATIVLPKDAFKDAPAA